jgi:hypothetical protein
MLPGLVNLLSFALAFLAGLQGYPWVVVPAIALLSWIGYLRFPSGVQTVIADWHTAGRGWQIKVLIYLLALPLIGFFFFMGTVFGA